MPADTGFTQKLRGLQFRRDKLPLGFFRHQEPQMLICLLSS